MQGRKAIKSRNQEAVKLIEKLKEKLELKTDVELAKWFGSAPNHISRWKEKGIPNITSKLIRDILK